MMPVRLFAFLLSLASLTAGMASCGNDPPAERPEDGSVGAWGSCYWDGSKTSDLCADGTVCTDYSICSPECDRVEECEEFGYDAVVCDQISGTGNQKVCILTCDEMHDCPTTGGDRPLECALIFKECH